jgi:peptidoglycan/LPS O-acetylase OafA/YrhL
MKRLFTGTATSHIALLTILRGGAAWWIVLFHFNQFLPPSLIPLLRPGVDFGFLAVDLFFMMSGYVMALNYHGWFTDTPASGGAGGRYRRFLLLRLARIYPLHLATLLLCLSTPLALALFSQHFTVPYRFTALNFVWNLLLLNNSALTGILSWNVPSWSISVEFVAYLLFPLLLRLSGHNVRRALPMLAALLAASMLMGATQGSLGSGLSVFALPRCLLEFSAGIAIWRLLHNRTVSPALGHALLFGGIAAVAICIHDDIPDYLFAPPGFVLILAGAVLARLPHWAERPVWALVVLGELSYSTYLVHFIVRDWVRMPLSSSQIATLPAFVVYIAGVLGVSCLTFFLVERPAQIYLRRLINVHFPSAPIAPTEPRP